MLGLTILEVSYSVFNISKENNKFEKSQPIEKKNVMLNWTVDLGVDKGIDVPFHVIVGFMQSEQFHLQTLNTYTFYQPRVSNAQRIGREKYPDTEIFCDYV